MIIITKLRNWCAKYWEALCIVLGTLATIIIGTKRQKDKSKNSEILLDQSAKEIEAIEKARKEESKKIIKAEIKYKIALKELEKKYDNDKSALTRDKDESYKKMLEEAKHDPEKLDNFLKVMGINEVKKS